MGRPPGSKTKQNADIAIRAAREGISPIEVMLKVMRVFYYRGDFEDAARVAAQAAPYCHPRLNAIAIAQNSDVKASLNVIEQIVEADTQDHQIASNPVPLPPQ